MRGSNGNQCTRWRGLGALLAMLLSTGLVPGQETASPPPAPDLTRVPRKLVREPEYASKEPLYGLYVFGPEARTRVWAVLDRSDEGLETPDILYFDRNANGDLTEDGERVDSPEGKFEIGVFRDPVTGEEHTDLQIQWMLHDEGPWVFFRMEWRGKEQVKGGYAVKPGPYGRFTPRPEEAPVLWPGAEDPLAFQPWMLPPLAPGEERDVKVFLGHPGLGPNTFCGLSNRFLPEEVPVLAALIYTDREGQEREARYQLQDRC